MMNGTIFSIWIMANYVAAAGVYAVHGDWGRAPYWLFALGVNFSALFLIK